MALCTFSAVFWTWTKLFLTTAKHQMPLLILHSFLTVGLTQCNARSQLQRELSNAVSVLDCESARRRKNTSCFCNITLNRQKGVGVEVLWHIQDGKRMHLRTDTDTREHGTSDSCQSAQSFSLNISPWQCYCKQSNDLPAFKGDYFLWDYKCCTILSCNVKASQPARNHS